MKKTTIQSLLVLILASAIIVGCKKKEIRHAPILDIPVFEVFQKQMPIYQEFVGQTYGESDIAIHARVEGYLMGMHFKEGSEVKQGQLLYTIDPTPFEEKVAGQASNVAEAETYLTKAQNDLIRIEPLTKTGASSLKDLDAAKASVEAAKAQVDAAKAGLRGSQIEKGYTRVTSPITGIIGISKAKEGDFISRVSSGVLTTVSDITKISVRFSITEAEYLYFSRNLAGLSNREEKYKGVQMILADGSVHPYKGSVDFMDREIDPTTGTIQLQATFPNPEKMVRPGQFCKIRAVMEVKDSAIFVPQRCVIDMQGISQVMVIDAMDSVRIRPVKLGKEVGNLYLVDEGLKPKDRVVLEGLMKVKPGMKVKPMALPYQITDDFVLEVKQ